MCALLGCPKTSGTEADALKAVEITLSENANRRSPRGVQTIAKMARSPARVWNAIWMGITTGGLHLLKLVARDTDDFGHDYTVFSEAR